MNIKQIDEVRWQIPKTGIMKVPALIYASKKLLEAIKKDRTLTQIQNVASLPGIYKHAIALPDAHEGYGFPIGGVAALDYEKGGLSPGGIGYDINCGVRLLRTNLVREDIIKNHEKILDELFTLVPSGLGSKSDLRLNPEQLDEVLNTGAKWAVENGYGNKDDLEHCESNGGMKEANSKYVSSQAKQRGKSQIGSLGAGNHFLEVQYVEEIYDKKVAKAFGIIKEGQVTIMIHCGSRGLGHQVCTDYLREMERTYPDLVKGLPDRELIYAPSGSKLAESYFGAMAAAANYAWCNRHMIGHNVREAMKRVFKNFKGDTIYDVAHNIAKIEEHEIDGKKVKVYMHRKGATRAFPPGHKEVSKLYREVGQPVIIPGSMGTASYILVGAKSGSETFYSTAHGAGRLMSRMQAKKQFWGETIKKELESRQIFIKTASWKGVSEEAPGAYKDIDEVVKVSHDAGIANLVAKVRPLAVVKG